jgi:hypothetical protein
LQLQKLNQNVDLPTPKCLLINKAALKMREYEHLRRSDVFDLAEPAEPVDLSSISKGCSFLGKRKHVNVEKREKVRHREYKVNEFVDSSKVIRGSSAKEQSQASGSEADLA